MQPTREFRLPELTVTASVLTDRGCVRETNEDNGRHVSAASAEGRGTLTIVADGMGGHNSGEIASEMAVDLISRYYYDDPSRQVTDVLHDAIKRSSAEIFESAADDPSLAGMGTTVVTLAIRDNMGVVAHVGDSRVYRLRGSNIERLTIDHSQVMEMVKMGLLSFDEAQDHEDKNVILRAVGTQPEVEVEVSEPFAVEPGDQFLLCSDGLSDMMSDDDIREVWANSPAPHISSARLVDLAKRRGGNDNITVGIVRVSIEDDDGSQQKVPATREIEVQ